MRLGIGAKFPQSSLIFLPCSHLLKMHFLKFLVMRVCGAIFLYALFLNFVVFRTSFF